MLSKSVKGDASHLPEYEAPPVNEVVLDAQFEPIPSFSLDAGLDIWAIFKKEYPTLDVGYILPPHQMPHPGASDPQIQIMESVSDASPDLRLLFYTKDKTTLIQLQQDRFIINWKKAKKDSEYLRFNNISKEYHKQFAKLKSHVKKKLNADINMTHAEVRYCNFIEFNEGENLSDWIQINNEFIVGTEFFKSNLNERVYDDVSGEKGDEIANFTKQITSGTTQVPADNHNPPEVISHRIVQAAQLILSFRGPINETMSIEEFFSRGRERIVSVFDEMTTSKAHDTWGRRERK